MRSRMSRETKRKLITISYARSGKQAQVRSGLGTPLSKFGCTFVVCPLPDPTRDPEGKGHSVHQNTFVRVLRVEEALGGGGKEGGHFRKWA